MCYLLLLIVYKYMKYMNGDLFNVLLWVRTNAIFSHLFELLSDLIIKTSIQIVIIKPSRLCGQTQVRSLREWNTQGK